jgi:sortase A
VKLSTGLERLLFAGGAALLAFAGGARLTGELQSEQALRRFQLAVAAGREGDAALATHTGDLDTSLWSPERVTAFRESLTAKFGAPVAVLSIPRIGLEVPVLVGTDEATLNRGVGLIAGTAVPGDAGNVGIAGHRDGYFRGLKDLTLGDTLELRTLTARERYVVHSLQIVSPVDAWVLDPTAEPTLTLVTCFPFYFVGSAPQRYIVGARRSSTVTVGEPPPMAPLSTAKSP